ncbi:hypothetical protein EVAR_74605_1 [Eumeta japonica]|uniref:Uncharacterized protein n=1 Tax=Eumeta variegata TaxID=151549 RepID=A0A4C1WB29_EUMVA|nr:hypothetical protein EVAR_74605_1 [Eumeta japonica]
MHWTSVEDSRSTLLSWTKRVVGGSQGITITTHASRHAYGRLLNIFTSKNYYRCVIIRRHEGKSGPANENRRGGSRPRAR